MQDLQRSNALPPPLSTAERKSLYKAGRLIDIVASGYQSTTWSKKELSETIDRTLSAAAVAKDMAHCSDIRPGQRISRNRMPRYVSHSTEASRIVLTNTWGLRRWAVFAHCKRSGCYC